jgi:hypothetical protein
LALTSPTGGGRSVGIVRSRTKATEFSLVFSFIYIYIYIYTQLTATTVPPDRPWSPPSLLCAEVENE